MVQYFTPSYSLYPVLADIARRATQSGPAGHGLWHSQSIAELKQAVGISQAALLSSPRPTPPADAGYSPRPSWKSCAARKAASSCWTKPTWILPSENAMALALQYPHVLVARTFSKAYSLCFQRVGYFVGHPDVDRRAPQNPRQLQRERPGTDRRAGHAFGPALLPAPSSSASSPPASDWPAN